MADQRITTQLMFEGNAEAAMNLYVGLFPDAEILSVLRFGPGEPGPEGTIKHAAFTLAGQRIQCIDSLAPHAFGFTPAMSLFVQCATNEELEHLYNALVEGGQALMPLGEYPFSTRYGWVNDRFGVSWQLNFGEVR